MVTWIEPVFDRTQADVDFAEQMLAKRINNVPYKGCLNVDDINRIENNIQYLSDELSARSYFPHTSSMNWHMREIPDMNDVARILGNIRKIIDAFHQSEKSPSVPEQMLTFEQINDIEENLYLIKKLLDGMTSCYRECGTVQCGEGW